MAKLWFQNSNGNKREIADCKDGREVNIAIEEFINDANDRWPEKPRFTSYYTRIWEEDGGIMFDVGSWSEFFFWEGTIKDYFNSK